MNKFRSGFLFLLLLSGSVAMAQEKPNIVLVFLDNFGWGGAGIQWGRDHSWCSDSASGQTGGRGSPPDKLQRRNSVHAIPFGAHDGQVRNPKR